MGGAGPLPPSKGEKPKHCALKRLQNTTQKSGGQLYRRSFKKSSHFVASFTCTMNVTTVVGALKVDVRNF